MNVGSIQAFLGGIQQSNLGGASSNIGKTAGVMAFGSVLSGISANSGTMVSPVDENLTSQTNEAVLAIFNATTVEELIAALEQEGSLNFEVPNLTTVNELDVEELVQTILPLLKQAGLDESEIAAASYVTDIWSLLSVIDDVAPNFFTEIGNALNDKGAIPKEQAVELLVLLKAITIEAPNTDLLMKQEQQVFSLQGFLVATGERFESTHSTNQSRNNIVQFMDSHHNIQMTVQNENKNESFKDTSKETAQQHVINSLSTTRSEVPIAELENRNNARNETFMREMQNIFKRSNFGQTGGTNRLLIKLYPEHLGQVRIELLQTNGIMTARILASNALGKEMLDSQLHQLRNAFLQQNLQVERIDITQTLQDASRNDRQDAFNQHFKKEQESTHEQDSKHEEEEKTFQEFMIDLEV